LLNKKKKKKKKDGLDVSSQDLRAAMRRQFETHRKLNNFEMADMLIWKGRLELEEVIGTHDALLVVSNPS
jgi:hypothetical protein